MPFPRTNRVVKIGGKLQRSTQNSTIILIHSAWCSYLDGASIIWNEMNRILIVESLKLIRIAAEPVFLGQPGGPGLAAPVVQLLPCRRIWFCCLSLCRCVYVSPS